MGNLCINRTNDAVFKTIFANQQHKDITLSLINAIFEFQGTEQVADIHFIDRELNADRSNGKDSRLDLLGETNDGILINIEIQVAPMQSMGRRSLFYWSRLYNHLRSGDKYTKLRRTVAINILEFNLFDGAEYPDYHSCFGVYNIKTRQQLTTDLEIHFFELPKWKMKNIKEMNRLEKWLSYFSKATSNEELEEIAMSEPMIRQALNAETIFSTDRVKRRAYEKAEKARRDRIAELDYAMEKGMEKGMENVARAMLQRGMRLEEVAEISKLPVEHLKTLLPTQ